MSNFGQYITNSHLASLRYQNSIDSANLRRKLNDLPSQIMREQIALEKYGVTWKKLANEFEKHLDVIFRLEKNCALFENNLVPFFNPDGTKKKLKISPDNLFGAIAISVLCSTPALVLLFAGYELWMKIVGFVLPVIITYTIIHLASPKHPQEYRRCSQDEIRNYFESWKNHKKLLQDKYESAKPIEQKLKEIYDICGSGGPYEVMSDYKEYYEL